VMEAARIAVTYRTPVILLTDTFLANSSEPWMLPNAADLPEIHPRFIPIHREAHVDPQRLREIAAAVNDSGRHFVFPIHPRTRRVLEEHRIALAGAVEVVEPLGYLEMLALVTRAEAVVTDSGGLQKEAYWLGVPCVTLRPSTEWVDTVEAGANRLAEPSELEAALATARFPAGAPPLYGDGHAAERVAAALYP